MLGNLVILLLAVVSVKSDDECSRETVDNCIPDTMKRPPEPPKGFPDKDYLDKYCSPAVEAAECLKDVAQKCPELRDIGDHLNFFELLVTFLHSVCDEDSDLKKGYLDNVDCYNRTLPQMEECVIRVRGFLDSFFASLRNSTDVRAGMFDGICVLVNLGIKCGVKESTLACGAEATLPLADISNSLSAIIMEAVCPEGIPLLLQTKLTEYIEEVGFELKKKRRK